MLFIMYSHRVSSPVTRFLLSASLTIYVKGMERGDRVEEKGKEAISEHWIQNRD